MAKKNNKPQANFEIPTSGTDIKELTEQLAVFGEKRKRSLDSCIASMRAFAAGLAAGQTGSITLTDERGVSLTMPVAEAFAASADGQARILARGSQKPKFFAVPTRGTIGLEGVDEFASYEARIAVSCADKAGKFASFLANVVKIRDFALAGKVTEARQVCGSILPESGLSLTGLECIVQCAIYGRFLGQVRAEIVRQQVAADEAVRLESEKRIQAEAAASAKRRTAFAEATK